MRAKWHKSKKLKNDNWQIVVTEIPYQVLKWRLIEKIAELIIDQENFRSSMM